MMTTKIKLPVTLMRGGTSKGAYLLRKDMPPERKDWDSVLLKLMGSPDRKQIDGLGGSQSVTSKVAITEKSSRSDADVDYTFAQVSVDKPVVSYGGNCGNISSGVGPFAIEEGLVPAVGEETTVRIFNTNTRKIIVETVNTADGQVCYDGDYTIAGVPGTAAPIKLRFLDPSGTLGKGILPTGNGVDELEIPDFGRLPVSIVDAANPLVFVTADSIKMNGTEQPEEINKDEALLRLLECIRGKAAVLLGLTDHWEKAAWETPGIPKMTIVAPPTFYTTAQGTEIKASEIDLLGRMMSMQKAHPSYAMTGAMCTAAAAAIPGTLVHSILSPCGKLPEIRIGHGSGTLVCGVETEKGQSIPFIKETYGYRTARLLMKGVAPISY